MSEKEKTPPAAVEREVMDAEQIERALQRMLHEVLERNRGASLLAVVGVQRRGVVLASRLADKIAQLEGTRVPVGSLDITLYRDDLSTLSPWPVVRETSIDFDVTGKCIILVDDVLFTGRTVRAALDELTDFGRPRKIELAVLVDRGHRELPISADYVGKVVPTRREDEVQVLLQETDGEERVVVRSPVAPSRSG